MKHFLIALMAGFTLFSMKAQQTYVKGYLVTDKGDTLKGEIKLNPKKEHEAYSKVFFKDQTGVQKGYKPGKTKAYGYDNTHYIAMDSEEEQKFFQVMASGAINLYKLGYEGMRMNEITHEVEDYIAKDDKMELVKESKFKKQISDWMKDNPEFINTYEDTKKFDADKAVEIIKQYNSWKAGK
jgi:hypothetical protein